MQENSVCLEKWPLQAHQAECKLHLLTLRTKRAPGAAARGKRRKECGNETKLEQNAEENRERVAQGNRGKWAAWSQTEFGWASNTKCKAQMQLLRGQV